MTGPAVVCDPVGYWPTPPEATARTARAVAALLDLQAAAGVPLGRFAVTAYPPSGTATTMARVDITASGVTELTAWVRALDATHARYQRRPGDTLLTVYAVRSGIVWNVSATYGAPRLPGGVGEPFIDPSGKVRTDKGKILAGDLPRLAETPTTRQER